MIWQKPQCQWRPRRDCCNFKLSHTAEEKSKIEAHEATLDTHAMRKQCQFEHDEFSTAQSRPRHCGGQKVRHRAPRACHAPQGASSPLTM